MYVCVRMVECGVKANYVASCFWASPHGVVRCGVCLGMVALSRFEDYSTALCEIWAVVSGLEVYD
jgi:hypothetical protein